MTRIDELIRQLAPAGIRFTALGDIAKLVRGNGMPKTDLTDGGVGAIHYGQIYTHYGVWATNTISFASPATAAKLTQAEPGDIIITNTSENIEEVGKAVAWLGEDPIVTGGHATVIKHDEDPKFLSYWFQSESFFAQKRALAIGTKVIDVSAKQLARVRIPVPPLEVQREIAEILDRFAEADAELDTLLGSESVDRELQQTRIRDLLLVRQAQVPPEGSMALNDIVEFTNGKAHERLVDPDGSIALLTARFISTAGKMVRWVNPPDVLSPASRGDIALVMSDLPNGRALARSFYVEESGKYAANQRVCLLRVRDRSSVSSRWLYHFLDRNPQLLAFDNGQDQTHLKKGQILDVRVPTLPISEQELAAATLDQFDALTRDLVVELQDEREARRQQYKFYRDRLLTFEEATT